ncbi:MAG: dTDP-glucose 4,6-dehydratase [Microgenomates group bacterium GW2011_GWC1_41_8]|uniref:dTDP-glucose 4,6-dehydratase n=3 Tax=Candidatus Roizmaniibacteriota TaxID=1752723 RepID=A0A0G0XEF3_9BACT|nr:MAG: dTDP-glucose 4,6-dehydratase [Candidatus Levybacteria bacterium GW2011_GWA2_40_16]KKR72778.1 MAG: dTDP-glucose 4,6-dehydratase [Candidatus Roizmanbacteria bacterium GW2011_GWB1_40_7]KKR94475.1 MAG: dTDP-glucose 4,6-dehydratase [Candidatus Roizmanbacteria bacterium GW2011_GWA1_41_13]KKS23205.1 MAG: dTDP-glucose 4,6-dehydratase [Candidatus Roizmanbacteria bacterium GW2011_GWC2_41_7]KKS24313.1 MAG: dTDP-glucose 4,6-dehydratase [Microgenomates group bacterium GW2011_GWC1_41_8]OGK48664.1 MA
MKLLVTGGAGFIGSNFIRYWLKNHSEDSIVNLDALTYAGNLENLSAVEKNPHYSFIKGDITDPEKVDQAMNEVDWVVHFAAESHVDRSITGPAAFVKTNIIGTEVLLDVALKHNVKRFHHVSTDEVFGALELDSTDKFNETTPYDPRSPYSASKAGSDHLVRAYYHTYQLPITITNCSNNFGPYHHPEKIIPLAITNLLENKKVPIYGDGLHVRDWLYVEDHCRAIDRVLADGKIGETYCIGGLTHDINNLEVVKKIIALMGKDESLIEFVKDRPGHDRRYAIDWSKIKNELGWEPKYDFDTWLGKTIEWFKEHESWWRNVKSGEYREYYEKQYSNS